jgi:hypothetical protein
MIGAAPAKLVKLSSGCFCFRGTEWMFTAHPAGYTLLGQGSLVIAMNRGVFLFILDLIAALFNALVNVLLAAGLRFVAAPTDGK